MFTSSRLYQAATTFTRTVVTLMTIAILAASPAIALDTSTASTSLVAPRQIINLDMCTLAYQLYHQSLCLPLDPWYDVFSRVGSSRRDNVCKFTHEYAAMLGNPSTSAGMPNGGFYSGPNAARGWANSNTNLDKSSYIGPHFQSTLDERRKLVLDIVDRMRKTPALDNAQEVDALVNDFNAISGNLGLDNEEQWIYIGMLLSRMQETALSLTDLYSKPEITKTLNATADD